MVECPYTDACQQELSRWGFKIVGRGGEYCLRNRDTAIEIAQKVCVDSAKKRKFAEGLRDIYSHNFSSDEDLFERDFKIITAPPWLITACCRQAIDPEWPPSLKGLQGDDDG